MKIGIDIDDTICDTWEYVMPYVAKYYNISYDDLKKSEKYYEKALDISLEEYCKFAKKFYDKITLNVPLKKDVVEVLNDLKNMGFEIIFITARSTLGYTNPYETSLKYLIKNNVPFDKLIVGKKDKKKICEEEKIDLFIDDSIENIKEVKKLNIDVLLFETKENKNTSLKKVKNFKEIKNYIEVKYGYKNCNC